MIKSNGFKIQYTLKSFVSVYISYKKNHHLSTVTKDKFNGEKDYVINIDLKT